MPLRLTKEEVVTMRVLAEKGQNHCEIARTLGVSEGTVRYHLRRAAEGAEDGRGQRSFEAESMSAVIAAWHAEREGEKRPINVQELHEHMLAEYGYPGTYRSVLRCVRARYPRSRRRTYRRVETPPGAQVQTDWGEYPQRDGLGRQFFDPVTTTVERIRRFPQAGSPVPYVPSAVPARWAPVKGPVEGFPYHVVYVITPEAIRILVIAHYRRRPGYWAARSGS